MRLLDFVLMVGDELGRSFLKRNLSNVMNKVSRKALQLLFVLSTEAEDFKMQAERRNEKERNRESGLLSQ